MHFFPTLLFSSIAISTLSQDIKSLDYASLMKKNHVKSRVCKEIKFKGAASDTLMSGEETFDKEGRIVSFTEYFAGGKVFAIYEYFYGEQNKIIRSTVKHTFNDFNPVEFILTYNASNKITSRELAEPIRNFWMKETFSYTTAGILVKAEQWYDQGGTLKPLEHRDYPPNLTPKDNSLTYLHDSKGLLILHRLYNSTGIVERSRKYDYSFFSQVETKKK